MKEYQFIVQIERDKETGLYVGYIPNLPGAHTQGETLDELHINLKEVAELVIESLNADEIVVLENEFIGTQEVRIAV